MFKFDANASPIMGVGVEGDFDSVRLREIGEHDLSPRLERVPGVASVTVEGGLRRQIHVELSKEKITALNLPVDRITSLLRSRTRTSRSARSTKETAPTWSAARGSSRTSSRSAIWS